MHALATHAVEQITLTASAVGFMRRMVRMAGAGGRAGFRLVVTKGGCSGLRDSFSVEAVPGPEDEVFDFGEVRLFVPSHCRPLLDGVTIDFVDSPMESGLLFADPKTPSCAS